MEIVDHMYERVEEIRHGQRTEADFNYLLAVIDRLREVHLAAKELMEMDASVSQSERLAADLELCCALDPAMFPGAKRKYRREAKCP